MIVIHKQVVTWGEFQSLMFPKTTQFLKVDIQGNNLVVWYTRDVDDKDTFEMTQFWIRATGMPFEDDPELLYLNTVQAPNGLVFHIFIK